MLMCACARGYRGCTRASMHACWLAVGGRGARGLAPVAMRRAVFLMNARDGPWFGFSPSELPAPAPAPPQPQPRPTKHLTLNLNLSPTLTRTRRRPDPDPSRPPCVRQCCCRCRPLERESTMMTPRLTGVLGIRSGFLGIKILGMGLRGPRGHTDGDRSGNGTGWTDELVPSLKLLADRRVGWQRRAECARCRLHRKNRKLTFLNKPKLVYAHISKFGIKIRVAIGSYWHAACQSPPITPPWCLPGRAPIYFSVSSH